MSGRPSVVSYPLGAFVPRNLRESGKSLLQAGPERSPDSTDGFAVTDHLRQNLKKLSVGRHKPVSYK